MKTIVLTANDSGLKSSMIGAIFNGAAYIERILSEVKVICYADHLRANFVTERLKKMTDPEIYLVLHENGMGSKGIANAFVTKFPHMHRPLIQHHGKDSFYGQVLKPLLDGVPWSQIQPVFDQYFVPNGNQMGLAITILNTLLIAPDDFQQFLSSPSTPHEFRRALERYEQHRNLKILSEDLLIQRRRA